MCRRCPPRKLGAPPVGQSGDPPDAAGASAGTRTDRSGASDGRHRVSGARLRHPAVADDIRAAHRRRSTRHRILGAPERRCAGRAFRAVVRRRVRACDVRREPNGMSADGSAHRVSARAARWRLAAGLVHDGADRAGLVRRGPHRRRLRGPHHRAEPSAGDGAAGVVTPEASNQSVDRQHAMLARMARIAIVGGGSIGEALLSGLLRAGRQVKDLVVAEKHPDRAKYLSDTYSVLVTTVADAVDTAAYVIVAVKPSDVSSVVGEIADAAAKAESNTAEQVFVSVVAGVTTEFYENKLPAGSPVIRVMPNAPVVVGGGVSALARGRFATADHLKEVSAIFDAVGGVLTVPES